jgi:hypothetical protein
LRFCWLSLRRKARLLKTPNSAPPQLRRYFAPTVAWDKNGKGVGHLALTVETHLDAAQYQNVRRLGLQVEQTVLRIAGN